MTHARARARAHTHSYTHTCQTSTSTSTHTHIITYIHRHAPHTHAHSHSCTHSKTHTRTGTHARTFASASTPTARSFNISHYNAKLFACLQAVWWQSLLDLFQHLTRSTFAFVSDTEIVSYPLCHTAKVLLTPYSLRSKTSVPDFTPPKPDLLLLPTRYNYSNASFTPHEMWANLSRAGLLLSASSEVRHEKDPLTTPEEQDQRGRW